MYKKLGFLLMAVFLFVALFTGCGLIEDAGFPAAETSEETPDRQAAANNAEGADAYRRMDTLGDYHFDPEGRMYYSGEDTVGRWVLTDEKTLGEEKPNGIRITAPSFEYVYKPGDLISDSVWFHAEGEAALDENLIYGSLYFADVSSGDVELDQELTVREYFRNNDGIGFDHVELSHFGWDTDGQSGAYQKDNGDRECHFFVSCNLPRLTAEGDTIYAVLDLKNTEGDLLTRILKGYTFEILDAEVAEKVLEAEAAEEEDGYDYEGDPAYFRMEYPGHWTLTDVHFIGGGEGEVKDGKPHGVGVRNFYYQGKWSGLDECVWIDGVMCGYDYVKELEFGAFEDQKIGFVVNDSFVGTMKVITSDGEEFDDPVTKFTV